MKAWFQDKTHVERLALTALGLFVVAAATYAIVKGRKQPVPIVFQNVPPQQTASDKAAPTEVVVHVVGAVKAPGIVHLPSTARVDDAIKAAGGTTSDSDTESINLAAKLIDGSQIKLPRKGKPEEVAAVAETYKSGSNDAYLATPPASAPSKSSARSGGKHPSGPVSLNTGSSSQLQTLPGVGPSTAQKILQYRMEHGGFSSVEELMAVKGIGPKKMKAMHKYLRL